MKTAAGIAHLRGLRHLAGESLGRVASRGRPAGSRADPAITTVAATAAGPRMSLVAWPMLSSMITKRKSTITAPAYTSTWIAATNSALSST